MEKKKIYVTVMMNNHDMWFVINKQIYLFLPSF